MADYGSQPGTSTGSGNIINYVSGCTIEHFNQHNHVPSTSSANVVIDYCPAPVSTFLGRSEELVALKTMFTRHPVVALVGMGGLGKTQLSRKHVLVNKADYQYKYWLESETPEKLKKSFKELAKILNIESDNINKVINDFYKKIGAVPTILVFDNVEKPADVYDYLPTRVDLPSGATIHVLVTSRWTDWTCDKHIEYYKLQPLNVSESLQIFEEKFGKCWIEKIQKEWEELARMLGYLPLALQVATSYIYKRYEHNIDLRMILADYMKLEEGADRLLNVPLTEYGYRSVFTSMMLTLKQIENKADNESNVQNDVQWKFAVIIINAAAYMDPDKIYKESLLKLVDNLENICKLDEALAILTEYSLINQSVSRGENTIYTVHRIIQSCIRHNQTLTGTADKYYIRVLKYAFAEHYYYKYELRYVNERASAVVDYYKSNPSTVILQYLANNNAITAMEAVLKLLPKNQAQIDMKELDLLYIAVGGGHLNMVRLLCKYGADINQLCGDGWRDEPPLHDALRTRNMEIATWLLENGAAPTVRNGEGRNALHEAIMQANHKMVPIIIETDRAVVNETDDYGQTPLHVINYDHNEEEILSTIRVLVESGADITAVDKDGNTVLHSVARSACAAAESLILQRNNDLINIVNKHGQTALHVIPYNELDIDEERIVSTVRVLVESGADLTKVDKQGNTVLHLAARGARVGAVSLILQRNNDLIDMKNEDGKTALHVIPYYYSSYPIDDERIISTVRVLVKSGADLTKVDKQGNTVLHLAARYARAESATLILQRNNDLIDIVNKSGETALDVIPYAMLRMEEPIVSTMRVLVKSGADLTKVDKQGNTVLYSAARYACAKTVTVILQRNKDLIDMNNEDGKTALHILGHNLNIYASNTIFAVKKTARVLIMNGLSLDTRDNKGCTPLVTVKPEFKDILRQVADECNKQLLVRPVKRQSRYYTE